MKHDKCAIIVTCDTTRDGGSVTPCHEITASQHYLVSKMRVASLMTDERRVLSVMTIDQSEASIIP